MTIHDFKRPELVARECQTCGGDVFRILANEESTLWAIRCHNCGTTVAVDDNDDGVTYCSPVDLIGRGKAGTA